MISSAPTNQRTPWLASVAAAAIVGVSLVAAFSMGSYVVPGRGIVGPQAWPQPIGGIAQLLVVESWPTYGTLEIRWVAWAAGTLTLTVLAAAAARRYSVQPQARALLGGLAGYCVLLVALVAALGATSPVAELGLSWTWQLALALTWMLGLYWWAVRLPFRTFAHTIAVSLAVLAAISLLYSFQGSQRYPNWPVGNVLLLTTACLAAVFLLGTWAYGLLVEAMRTRRRGYWAAGLAVAVLFLLVAIALSMSGRRAGILGLMAGGGFILVLAQLRSRRAWTGVLVLAVVAASAGVVLVPKLFKSGRWETVVLRAALYENTFDLLKQNPLIGVGPGQLGAYLTSAMRPQHTESPRLFHGDVSDQAHSEPLHALAELGLSLGLLYLVVPLGGLVGYVIASRRLTDDRDRLVVLGLGAALAAVMAAEATSVGMRHPGVPGLLWALVGIGYAAGLRSGGFDAIARYLDARMAQANRYAMLWWAAWVAAAAGLCVAAVLSMAGAYHLNNGMRAWNRDQWARADAELAQVRLPPASDQWLIRQYLQGRANLLLARQATNPQESQARQAKAVACLGALVSVSPAYKDGPIWLGRALNDPGQLVGLCENLRQIDPYDREGLLILADRAANPADRLAMLRASLRNEEVIAPLAEMIAAVAQDPAAQPVLRQWLADADKALLLADPAQWPDPLALESYRLVVIVHGERGEMAQAAAFASKAAVLCKSLEQDVRRRRREAVELETYLDQAWFGWLMRPEASRSLRAALDERSSALISGEAESFSARMTMQFLAMLHLVDDKQGDAFRALLVSQGATAQREMMGRMMGTAYARLVAACQTQPATTEPAATRPAPTTSPAEARGPLASGAPSASQVANWVGQGKRILGAKAWAEALESAAAHRSDPWWRGVLAAE
jgi:hypothetical protein